MSIIILSILPRRGDGLGGEASSRRREDSFERASAKANPFPDSFPVDFVSQEERPGRPSGGFDVTAATRACGGACLDSDFRHWLPSGEEPILEILGYQRFGSRAAVARLYHVGSKGLAEREGFEYRYYLQVLLEPTLRR